MEIQDVDEFCETIMNTCVINCKDVPPLCNKKSVL